jgi:hypothetical protein
MGIQPKMLDPDPKSMNPDPICLLFLFYLLFILCCTSIALSLLVIYPPYGKTPLYTQRPVHAGEIFLLLQQPDSANVPLKQASCQRLFIHVDADTFSKNLANGFYGNFVPALYKFM